MNIELKPEYQQVIDDAILSGRYSSAQQVVQEALEIMKGQLELEAWIESEREEISAQIEVGFRQAENGNVIEGDRAIEMLKRRREERLNTLG